MPTVAAPSLNANPTRRTLPLPPERALALPILFAVALAAWAAYEPVLQNDRLFWSILGSAAALLATGATDITWSQDIAIRRRGRSLAPRRRHLAYVTLWATVFAAISAAQGLGDRQRGQWVPFRREACPAERAGACDYLSQVYSTLCDAGSRWSCGELRTLRESGRVDARHRPIAARRGTADPAWEQGAGHRSNADTFVRSCMRAGMVVALVRNGRRASWQDGPRGAMTEP